MKLLRKASSIFDATTNLVALLAGVLILFTMLFVTAEVCMRYFLARPIRGAGEITEYALVYIAFLGAAWVLRRGKHVKMDLVLIQLNLRAQTIICIITSILGAITCLVVTWYGLKMVWECFQDGILRASGLEPPMFLLLAIIPVGSLLLFIEFLRTTYGYLVNWRASPGKEQKPP